MPDLRNAHIRHAMYYETVLRTAEELYEQGGEAINYGLELLDQEWGNIKLAQAWAEKYAENDFSAAKLCSNYPNVGIFALSRISMTSSAQLPTNRRANNCADSIVS